MIRDLIILEAFFAFLIAALWFFARRADRKREDAWLRFIDRDRERVTTALARGTGVTLPGSSRPSREIAQRAEYRSHYGEPPGSGRREARRDADGGPLRLNDNRLAMQGEAVIRANDGASSVVAPLA